LRKRGGFTLIELLVVIAIIAILAAVLFPVFAKARQKARQTACLSNSRQIGTAIMSYAQDYDERFPQNWLGRCANPALGDPGYGWDWMETTQPYAKNWPLYTCPSGSWSEMLDGMFIQACALGLNRSGVGRRGGYALNSGRIDPAFPDQIDPGPGGNSTHFSKRMAQLKVPAGVIMVTEVEAAGCGMLCGTAHAGGRAPWFANNITGRHNEGCNNTFTDGHAKWLKRTLISNDIAGAPMNPEAAAYWGRRS